MGEKDKNQLTHSKDIKIVLSDMIGNDKYLEFVSKKIDKVSAAIYLVTSVFPENDPLRTSLRSAGVELVKSKMSLLGKKSENQFETIILPLIETTSLIEVASQAGLVSLNNASILLRECEQLIVGLRERVQRHENPGIALGNEFFKLEARGGAPEGPTGSLADHSQEISSMPARNVLYKEARKEPNGSSKVAEKKKSRRTLILKLLQEKEHISIKDFTHLIKDCSEKTVQRELLDMVKEGVIEKKGERRWSTYSLKG